MEAFFSGVGAVVLTARTVFWLCGLSYLVFGVWTAYVAFVAAPVEFPAGNTDCNKLSQTLQGTAIWALVTNALGLLGGASFYYGEKGETVSVIGGLVYSFNFVSMVALFISIQMNVFGSDVDDCGALVSGDVRKSFDLKR